MFTRFDTREAWLRAAVRELDDLFAERVGVRLPTVQVSVGWPGGRSAGRSNAVIGQCWHRSAAADSVPHIFISPVLDDAPRVLDVLAHELVHAADDNASGHKGRFAEWAKGIGLAGKMTATVAGEELAQDLTDLVRWNLGTYPHGRLGDGVRTGGGEVPGSPGGGGRSHPPQTTRMLKASCDCDPDPYILRITRKQAERGAPRCGLCGSPMTVEGVDK